MNLGLNGAFRFVQRWKQDCIAADSDQLVAVVVFDYFCCWMKMKLIRIRSRMVYRINHDLSSNGERVLQQSP